MIKTLKTAVLFTVISLILSMILPVAPAYCLEPFAPGDEVRINAWYETDAVQGLNTRVDWTVQYAATGNIASWKFYQGEKGLFCTVDADQSARPFSFSLTDAKGASLQKSTGAFIPVSGFPVPCQIFALEKFKDKETVKTVRFAGGRRFVMPVSYSCETIKYETAVENGWIAESFLKGVDPESGLFMVTFKNDYSDTVLFRQLWQENAGWWLYQESGMGRFWRY